MASNATLNNIEGFLADDPDLTITINRSDLELVMTGEKSLEAQIIMARRSWKVTHKCWQNCQRRSSISKWVLKYYPDVSEQEKQNPFQVNPVDQGLLGDG